MSGEHGGWLAGSQGAEQREAGATSDGSRVSGLEEGGALGGGSLATGEEELRRRWRRRGAAVAVVGRSGVRLWRGGGEVWEVAQWRGSGEVAATVVEQGSEDAGDGGGAGEEGPQRRGRKHRAAGEETPRR